MTTRVLLQPAFILHRRPYRDSSLLLEALSMEHGRLGLVARGAAGPRSRLRGLLQPFVPLLLSWSGAGDLVTLIGAEEQPPQRFLPTARVLSGFYANELLVKLLPRRDPCPELFKAYARLLTELSTAAAEEPALRGFEKCLLAELGYGLNLEHEAHSGAPIVAELQYQYVLDRGPLAAAGNVTGVPISGRGLLALRDGTLDDPLLLREAKCLTRAALAVQLQGQLLKTRELYRVKRTPRPE